MTVVEAPAVPALPVRISGVGRRFPAPDGGDRVVLRDIDLDIRAGEIVALLGPSGCGKSTLLRLISGLDRADAGQLSIGDSPVAVVDQRCAVAFQEPRLLPWRTISRNVELGLPRGTAKEKGRERVAELLRLVQLDHATNLRPRQISGGMAQRASLARALARNPRVLLLDEPFGALDALTRLTMQDLLLEVHAAEPTTIVLVTHDVDEALQLADRIVLLGSDDVTPGATIRRVLEVGKKRPRDRGDAQLAVLRAELLSLLGVESHHPEDYITKAIKAQRAKRTGA
ncbi:ABC transporter ATP-binding protein [Protaetiibacter sp. SSC-01]|uniref:ABC transporter ATP-binding protein n=1 Tax=Protaetiibacter sp. SSC-01 TaxID=2759943 RepID=UPI0016572527|nr:ABC transporter ATP-binding protein [Protaetiibacter sp. SSC-01]QNO36389.1 ABC transporter ATP-binding protein [Protaetiibacter sp. SSC-01]